MCRVLVVLSVPCSILNSMNQPARSDASRANHRQRVGVSVRLLGLLVASWGAIIALVGGLWFSTEFNTVPAYTMSQSAQVVSSAMQQSLESASSPEIGDGVVSAGIEQSGTGWSVSVDGNAVDQVGVHNLRIEVGQLNLLEQMIPIRIYADNVTAVTPIIRNETTLEEFRLRQAQAMSNGQWVQEWAVDDIPAGTYRVQLEIESDTGPTYMAYDGNVYRLPSQTEREAALAAGRDSVEALYESLEDIRQAANDRPAGTANDRAALLIPGADSAQGSILVYLESVEPADLQLQTASGAWRTVGSFTRQAEGQQLRWDTTQYQDGWYAVRAIASNGEAALSASQSIRIANNGARDLPLRDTRTVDEKVNDSSGLSGARVAASEVVTESDVAPTADISRDTYEVAAELLAARWPSYQKDVNQFSDQLATALRAAERQAISRAKQRFRALEEDLISRLDGRPQSVIEATRQILRNRLNERILRVEQAERYTSLLVAQSNALTASSSALTDPVLTDPEVSFYALSTSSDVQSDSQYLEPKTAGVTRADLLQVEAIGTTSVSSGARTTGVLRGTALPNTTIRLFIYSNPVVVTLETNADGTWEYQFDTELEDGEHEVYVALTDGVGQVVARSNPFRFAKTAQAFSPIDRVGAGAISQSNQTGVSLLNWPLVYLIVSLSVVVIGFLIMVVGATIRSREANQVVIKTKILR